MTFEKEMQLLNDTLAQLNLEFPETVSREVFYSHMKSLWERLYNNDLLVDDKEAYEAVLDELEETTLEKARLILTPYYDQYNLAISMMEIVLVATHIQVNAQERNQDMKEVLVVIGHRMGKGDAVARGVEKAGGKAIVIPGMAADMKLGDVMNEHQADIGISFCGSGGAGAITAANKYGYKATSHVRSIQAAVTAVEQGYQVIGLGFMDVEELGQKIVEAYLKREA